MKKFLKSKKRSLKEAGKVLEYTTTVERALQACEVIHAISHGTSTETNQLRRNNLINQTGLIEKEFYTLTDGSLSWKVSVLISTNDTDSTESGGADGMSRYRKDELIIAISDVTYTSTPASSLESYTNSDAAPASTLSLLRLMSPGHVDYLPLRSAGLVAEDVTVHKSILRMSIKTLQKLSTRLLAKVPVLVPVSAESDPVSSSSVLAKSASKSSDSSSTKAKVYRRVVNDHPPAKSNITTPSSPLVANITATVDVNTTRVEYVPEYTSVRVLGYSLGASVGAYVSMLLDGTLNITLPDYIFEPATDTVPAEEQAGERSTNYDDEEIAKGSKKGKRKGKKSKDKKLSKAKKQPVVDTDDSPSSLPDKDAVQRDFDLDQLLGLYSQRVQCICISPAACISRTVVPQYITSVICGDDIVPRASPEAVEKLQKRLNEVWHTLH